MSLRLRCCFAIAGCALLGGPACTESPSVMTVDSGTGSVDDDNQGDGDGTGLGGTGGNGDGSGSGGDGDGDGDGVSTGDGDGDSPGDGDGDTVAGDGDGVPTDLDGDGVTASSDCNDDDAAVFPGAAESCDDVDSDCDGSLVDDFDDNDGDGRPDCVDDDDDNDGVSDADELGRLTDPLDEKQCGDSDVDGCDDCTLSGDLADDGPDAAPAGDGPDQDGDGLCDVGDPDDDGDGVTDLDDIAPLDPLRCSDDDADGCDDCSGGSKDTAADGTDYDGDGLCDLGDDDDDNDGVSDTAEASAATNPLDEKQCGDSDADACDDCAITGDLADDGVDAEPGNDGADWNGDGLCDVGDPLLDVLCSTTPGGSAQCAVQDGIERRVCGGLRLNGDGTGLETYCVFPNDGEDPFGSACAGGNGSTCEHNVCAWTSQECSVYCTQDSDCDVYQQGGESLVCTGYGRNPGPTYIGHCMYGCADDDDCNGLGDQAKVCSTASFRTEQGPWDLDTVCEVPTGPDDLGSDCTGGGSCISGLCLTTFIGTICASDADCLDANYPLCVVRGGSKQCATRGCTRLCDPTDDGGDATADCQGGAPGNRLTECGPVSFLLPDGQSRAVSMCGTP